MNELPACLDVNIVSPAEHHNRSHQRPLMSHGVNSFITSLARVQVPVSLWLFGPRYCADVSWKFASGVCVCVFHSFHLGSELHGYEQILCL